MTVQNKQRVTKQWGGHCFPDYLDDVDYNANYKYRQIEKETRKKCSHDCNIVPGFLCLLFTFTEYFTACNMFCLCLENGSKSLMERNEFLLFKKDKIKVYFLVKKLKAKTKIQRL